MSRDDRERLADIGDAVRAIQSYARADAGPASDATRDAILFRFAGLRDILTHEYFRIDLEIVEEIVNERLPLLHELIDDLLE